jgi:hypothetical protein
MRNAYTIFVVGDAQGKRQLETWEDNADIHFFLTFSEYLRWRLLG